jgi:uncharacterized membrane-anchored protein
MNLLEKIEGKTLYIIATLAYFLVAGIMIVQAYLINDTLKQILEKL